MEDEIHVRIEEPEIIKIQIVEPEPINIQFIESVPINVVIFEATPTQIATIFEPSGDEKRITKVVVTKERKVKIDYSVE